MPELILDKQVCLSNIGRMANRARQHDLVFRPHCKTHQSAVIASWFRDFGVTSVTVSSFRMANYFVSHDWKDILVAFPFMPADLGILEELGSEAKISILVDDPHSLSFLKATGGSVDFYVDIDTGYGRSGIRAKNVSRIEELLVQSRSIPCLNFAGFYCHAGHSYKTSSQDERDIIHRQAMQDLGTLKERFRRYGARILYGDTPNCSTVNDFGPIDEITPGNFVFYDLIQREIGSCATEDIAVTMNCPVVGKYEDRMKIVIHGGAVHFSKEQVRIGSRDVFGEVRGVNGEVPEAIYPVSERGKGTAYLNGMSQEHGILEECETLFHMIRPGDTLQILPAHSCLTANLMREYVTTEGERITTLNS